MSFKTKFEALVNSKLQTLARQLGATYAVKDFALGGRGGSYNLVCVFALVLLVCACFGKFSMLLAAIVASSTIASLLLDRESLSRKLNLTALPAQLGSYLHLVVLWLGDIGPGFILCFLCYSLVEPYLKKVCLWDGNSFWVLYGLYAIVRLFFSAKYLLTIWTRWDEARAPFEIRRMNLRSRGAAARHILWSFFMGNAGLAVRCGQQIATIVLFDKLQILLGMEDLRLGPFAAIVGVLGWLFISYISLSRVSPMYYKLHRTLHENKTLYAAVHRIHHKGVYPTVLDAGTETPLELALNEPLSYSQCILPDWLYTALQIPSIFIHYKGHHSSISKEDRLHFHVDHHRLFLHNFGFTGDYPLDLDRAFGTLFTGKHDEMPVGASTAETGQ